ncbi:AarF/UbiB family protein [Lutimonas halocynthiae]|uniref:ABC1 kinase family protein n=1 Tax=Lutimonas halocynthiae TaxID=1446477 RepID=UPI0025B28BA9|nr:AarF/UbiB family protein [Lutimonas halocynthiae]MDN3644114.1 AarF/UbiB family protein [Lutimonas halocynthiae]
MNTIDRIPITKIERASNLVHTGAKVGVNYLKYYGNKLTGTEGEARAKLNEDNAEDIYDGLKKLKGSALKVAQMLSMEKSLMPQAYVEKFSLSQFSVPPLSPALVLRTFKKYFGKSPQDVFDSFDATSVNAASIGQVHKAVLNNKTLAVKIQYPGVANSIGSDLALVKPIAIKMFNIRGKDSDKYFKEVEGKLMEETNYDLEIEQSLEIVASCKHIPNLEFPDYYPDLSSEKILTMDWMNGIHISEYVKLVNDQQDLDQIGQALWDFYMYQIHVLKKVHADPHPGNFLVSPDKELIALDFGCIKTIPDSFYLPYFELATNENLANPILFKEKLYELEILLADDSKEEVIFFTEMFHELLTVFTEPFQKETFDFSDDSFFSKLSKLSEKYSKNTQLRKMNGNRGSKHFIYMNRTFFGLYNLMFDLKAKNVAINNYKSL